VVSPSSGPTLSRQQDPWRPKDGHLTVANISDNGDLGNGGVSSAPLQRIISGEKERIVSSSEDKESDQSVISSLPSSLNKPDDVISIASDVSYLAPATRRDTAACILQCEYCHKRFTHLGDDEIKEDCAKSPNAFSRWVANCWCVKGWRAGWYHCSKDELEEAEFDIGCCRAPDDMPSAYWCLVGILSCLCLPCLCVWCPLNLCSFCVQRAGVVGPHRVNKVFVNQKEDAKESEM